MNKHLRKKIKKMRKNHKYSMLFIITKYIIEYYNIGVSYNNYSIYYNELIICIGTHTSPIYTNLKIIN